EGKECVMLVHDYTKRLRPVEESKDEYIRLANIVDELTVIAKTRRIPVVTAAQMRRDALRAIEDAAAKGHLDAIRNMGQSQIGGSIGIIENTDYAFILHRERKASTDTEYVTVKRIKGRGRQTGP